MSEMGVDVTASMAVACPAGPVLLTSVLKAIREAVELMKLSAPPKPPKLPTNVELLMSPERTTKMAPPNDTARLPWNDESRRIRSPTVMAPPRSADVSSVKVLRVTVPVSSMYSAPPMSNAELASKVESVVLADPSVATPPPHWVDELSVNELDITDTSPVAERAPPFMPGAIVLLSS